MEITATDIPTLQQFSRQFLRKISSFDDVERKLDAVPIATERDRMRQHYLRQGLLAVRGLLNERASLTPGEATALVMMLEQSDLALELMGDYEPTAGSVRPSCIGTCTQEKDACKAACGQKYCGCQWNAFLCKLNCFFSIKVTVEV